MFDTIVTGGDVIDGSGAARVRADIGIEAGLITHLGPPGSLSKQDAAQRIDADGLVVSPGFVDIHTHLDAQVLWDRVCSPSPLHGVTTVVGGNCGFTIAPNVESESDYVLGMLSRVEGIPYETLKSSGRWGWSTFGEYLDQIAPSLGVNAGFLVGHSTIRRTVMRERSAERANDDDLRSMRLVLRESLAAGALGFSSSWTPNHNDFNGDPVPSRSASAEELVFLSEELRNHPSTALEFIPNRSREPFDEPLLELMTNMSLAARLPLNWNILSISKGTEQLVAQRLGASDYAAARGGAVYALAVPDLPRIRYSFLSGFGLDTIPGWAKPMALRPDEKTAFLSNVDHRATLRAGMIADPRPWDWNELVAVETFSPKTKEFEGLQIGELAARLHKDAFDVVCDLVIQDGLRTALQPPVVGDDAESWALRAEVWRDPRVVLGASDTGAHLDMLSTFNYPTTLLELVRNKAVMSLEEAIYRITDVQARLYGLAGRGRIQRGYHADLVVFDPATIAPGTVYTRDDLPGGGSRLYSEAIGIRKVLVNGVELVNDGAFTDARPGHLIRAGIDTVPVTLSTNN